VPEYIAGAKVETGQTEPHPAAHVGYIDPEGNPQVVEAYPCEVCEKGATCIVFDEVEKEPVRAADGSFFRVTEAGDKHFFCQDHKDRAVTHWLPLETVERIDPAEAKWRRENGLYGVTVHPAGWLRDDRMPVLHLTPEQREAFRRDWEAIHKGMGDEPEIAILPKDSTWHTFPPNTLRAEKPECKERPEGGYEVTLPFTFDPADAAFVESRKQDVENVARGFGLPPHLLEKLNAPADDGGFVVPAADEPRIVEPPT